MIDLLLAALAPQTEAPALLPRLVGVVGICVRWEADPLHVAEVVVVRPSGNQALDNAMVPTAKATIWPKVAGDTGGWTVRWVSMGGVPIPPGPQPDCSHLPRHVWPPA